MRYNNVNYYFIKDLFGNVQEMIHQDGTTVARYEYDAWGNCEVTYNPSNFNDASKGNMANVNPFRYRGYYMDVETGYYYLQSRYYDPAIRRFISSDSYDLISTLAEAGDINLFAYCGNNPVMCVDPAGYFWDYVFDAAFILWGVYDLINGGYKNWENWVTLGVDVMLAVLPFVPSGAGQIIKVGNKIDNALDVAKTIYNLDNLQDLYKVTMIGRNMDRVTDTATLIGRADDLYVPWKGFDKTATGLKRIVHNGISVIHDVGWMSGKLRTGYTVIDIGITTMHKYRGLYYGGERLIIGFWETRNLLKLPINYYF